MASVTQDWKKFYNNLSDGPQAFLFCSSMAVAVGMLTGVICLSISFPLITLTILALIILSAWTYYVIRFFIYRASIR